MLLIAETSANARSVVVQPASAAPLLNLGFTRVTLPRVQWPWPPPRGATCGALRNVSFTAPPSTVLGIIGANGAGNRRC
jgi:ABC-type uncharacterized transport system ATPase subunit